MKTETELSKQIKELREKNEARLKKFKDRDHKFVGNDHNFATLRIHNGHFTMIKVSEV